MSWTKSALEFESALRPETKKFIEGILDTVDPCSTYSGDVANSVLERLIGSDPAYFVRAMLDFYSVKEIQGIAEISEETRNYLEYIYGKYSYKLRGILSGRKLDRPDEWIQVNRVSVRFDTRAKDLLMKFAIQKANKECLIIEDTYRNLVTLLRHILRHICESPELETHRQDVSISREDTELIIKYAVSLGEKISGIEKKEK